MPPPRRLPQWPRCRTPASISSSTLLECLADYGFEYSDEEAEEEDVDIENQYYNSKGLPAVLLHMR